MALDIKVYYAMLKYKRPAGSGSERRFITLFIDSIEGMHTDDFGNRYIVIGDDEPTTMFSSHTDTMHVKHGRQKLEVDEGFGLIYSVGSDVLGADDATGVFLMMNLIDAGVEGLYVFHRCEERGGLGSNYFAENCLPAYPNLNRCIAFDRKGYSSVISYQMGERCASSEFVKALALELGVSWSEDETGVFTDSANYMDVIPECTNISVGYFKEHTENEYQDITFLQELVLAVLAVPWETLPTLRDPTVIEYDGWTGTGTRTSSTYLGRDNWNYDYDRVPQTRDDVESMVYMETDAAIDLICDLLAISENTKQRRM